MIPGNNLMGGAATAVVFSVMDPGELNFFGHPVEASRHAVYTVGFLVAWLSPSCLCRMSIVTKATGGVSGFPAGEVYSRVRACRNR